jgi:hypothetical protein
MALLLWWLMGLTTDGCLFVDQSDGVSVLQTPNGSLEMPAELPEGAWLCPPGHRPPATRFRRHPTLPSHLDLRHPEDLHDAP